MKNHSILTSLVLIVLAVSFPVAADQTELSSAVAAEARVWIQSPMDMQEVLSLIHI